MADLHPIDGVTARPATSADLATFQIAQQRLDAFKTPKIANLSDPNTRVFVVLLDGTGNDVINNPNEATNVGIAKGQLEALNNPNIGVGYVKGPGTQSGLSGVIDSATGGTYGQRIEQAYDQLIDQSSKWLTENPNAKIVIIEIGFSRGAAQVAGFTRIVEERGIQDPSSKILIPRYNNESGQTSYEVAYTSQPLVAPGQTAQAVGVFDPVGTGVPNSNNMQLASSVVTGFQLVAGDEHRTAFPSKSIIDQGESADGRFFGATTAGAHSNNGGSYRLNGLSNRNFNLMASFINSLSDTPILTKLPEPPAGSPLNVIHNSVEHQSFYRHTKKRGVDEVLNASGAIDPAPANTALMRQFNYSNVGGAVSQGSPAKLNTQNGTETNTVNITSTPGSGTSRSNTCNATNAANDGGNALPAWLIVYQQRAAQLQQMQLDSGLYADHSRLVDEITPYEQGKLEGRAKALKIDWQASGDGLRR